MRTNLDIADLYDQSTLSQDILSKTLEDWAHQRVMAKADFLEYSNIQFNLNSLPTNQLAGR